MGRFIAENWMKEEMERRKKLFTDLFDGRSVSHLPVEVRVRKDRYTVREQYFDREKQLEDALESVRQTWKLREKTDAIPSLFPDVGCSGLANAFGADYFFNEDDNQTPGIKNHPLERLEEWLQEGKTPKVEDSLWLNEGLSRMALFAEAGDGFVPVCGLDAAGGLNVASDVMGLPQLLIAMTEEPEHVHKLLDLIQELYIELIQKEICAAGGLENMTTTDFYPGWAPMAYKGHCSDDISAMISPAMYLEFSAPYHAKIYRKYGGGGLHNCGPNPCHREYFAHRYAPRYLDLSEKYSTDDLKALKDSMRGKAFLRWISEMQDIEEIEACYRKYMGLLAPDVMLVPMYTVSTAEEGIVLYERLRPLAEEYADRMNFGWSRVGEEQ